MNNYLKVVHIPFSGRNPYQKLLADALKNFGLTVKGATVRHMLNVSYLNVSILTLLFKNWKPDIIHLHWQSAFLYVDGSRFKTTVKSLLFIFQIRIVKMLGIKLVWTIHNLKSHEDTFRDLEARYTKKLANLSNGIIVHCRTGKDEVSHQMGKKINDRITIIPHGHFLDYYPNRTPRDAARQKLNLHRSEFTFLFIGELRYYKGVVDLIDAFKAINTRNIRLIIAGRPHDRRIRDEVSAKTIEIENITTHYAFVPDRELQDYINASDVMVFPYRDIFTSGGIFLALTFGKPIIAPALGCIADALRTSPNFIYDTAENHGLIHAMKAAMGSNHLISIGRYNRDLADQFNWQEIAEKTTDVYRECLTT